MSFDRFRMGSADEAARLWDVSAEMTGVNAFAGAA
jgi:hypothetical protein